MANQLPSPIAHILARVGRSTKANKELSHQLEQLAWPAITDYELFKTVQSLYKSGIKLNLRHDHPSLDDFKRLRRQLRKLQVIRPDPNYGYYAHRILLNPDRPAEELCCIVDPFCCISHLSAMQRYGLTDRRPKALSISVPASKAGKVLVDQKMKQDHDEDYATRLDEIVPLRLVHHPDTVRDRQVQEHRTEYPGQSVQIRGNLARITTIGQTFVDMLNQPGLCGGMPHVIDVWREHATIHLDQIIRVADTARNAIVKVRAGYILRELLGVQDSRINAWKKFAMRGGSRLLDPSKPYAPTYSEDWQISVNV